MNIVRLLVEKGANVNESDEKALINAIENSKYFIEDKKKLLENQTKFKFLT